MLEGSEKQRSPSNPSQRNLKQRENVDGGVLIAQKNQCHPVILIAEAITRRF